MSHLMSQASSPPSSSASSRQRPTPSQTQQKTISSFFRPAGATSSAAVRKRSAAGAATAEPKDASLPPAAGSRQFSTSAGRTTSELGFLAKSKPAWSDTKDHVHDGGLQGASDGDDGVSDGDDEVVPPSRKRVRLGQGAAQAVEVAATTASSKTSTSTSAADRTERFRFSQPSSAPSADAIATDDSVDSESGTSAGELQQKRALHQQFVRKLGGANCAISLDRPDSPADAQDAGLDDDAELDDEELESAKPIAKARGSGAGGARKKGQLTPLERQVIDIKKAHPDTILVIEVGYKFRFFGEDARIAARELSIVCIPGKVRFDEHPSEAHLTRFASASIPVHRLHVHVKRLVAAGHKVGVVRQLETAALKAAGSNRNAPFIRKLTNLYTKGTYIDDVESISPVAQGADAAEQSSNTGYLLCLTEANAKGSTALTDETVQVGMLAVQPATGDIIYDNFQDGFMRSEIETRLLHIAPCEFLVVGDLSPATDKLVKHLATSKMNVFGDRVRVEHVPKQKTAEAEAHSYISSFYAALAQKADSPERNATSAELLGRVLSLAPNVTICLSAMIKHMKDYGLEHVFDLTKYFQPFSARSHMLLNGNTLTNLEIYQNQTDHAVKGSLFWTMDRTRTRSGQRMLRKWIGRPLIDKRALEERVNAVEELLHPDRAAEVERLKRLLNKVRIDLEKSLIRIYYGKCTRPELLAVLQTLQMIAGEYAHVTGPQDAGFRSAIIAGHIASLPAMQQHVRTFLDTINLHAAKTDDRYNFFSESHETEDITDCKMGIASVEYELNQHLTSVAETLGRKKMSYVTVAGIEYLIEVENSPYNNKKVPASWRKISGTKKVSRFHTPEVVRYMRERDQRKEELAAACDRAYASFLAEISQQYQSLRDCVSALATLDALLSLAEIASLPGYVKPSYADDARIVVKQGRHPMVEQLLLDSYVPNDTNLSHDETRALLVTGPNMGGKSSYVRQIALIAIMGQIGSYVPAESATLGMLDAVYTRMGAFDNMLTGESTFMVELSETSDILKQATPRSLVILDELGRGTSTHDGVAIAQAVLDYVTRELGCLTLFITHYQHLTAMQRAFSAHELQNVHMGFREEGTKDDAASSKLSHGIITFLYEVVPGEALRSYGLNVARLANVPDSVLALAAEKSSALEAEIKKRQLLGFLTGLGQLLEVNDDPESGSTDCEEQTQRITERLELL
ncbi:Mismatch repair protein msh3 [Ascosphaera acerosa]|nr:Mismatch repair protein msh3 [Ascosphaera acerosa]